MNTDTIIFRSNLSGMPKQRAWIVIYSLDGIRKWKRLVGYTRKDVRKRFFDIVDGRHHVEILDINLE